MIIQWHLDGAKRAYKTHSGFYTLIYCLHVCYSANLMSSIWGGHFTPCKGTSDTQVLKPTKSTRFHETHEITRNPTRPHGFPREPTKPLKHWFYIPRKMCFSPGWKTHGIPRNPTKTHGIPRKPTESHDRGFYTSFFPRWKTHENLRNPTNTHGVPWNPTESHDHGFYMFIYYFIRWGAGIPIKIKHVFMWCVNQEPATCPHLMQGSLQKYHPKSG